MDFTLSDIGLALDIAGALLIYINGLSPGLSEEGGDMIITTPTRANRSRATRRKWLSRLGIGLLVVGFACQIFGNHLTVSIPVKF